MIRLSLPVVLLAASCTTTDSAPRNDRRMTRVERTLEGLTAGTPRRCLPNADFNEMRTARDVIVFVAGRNRVWRNDMVGSGCGTGLSRGDTVITQPFNGQLCSGDIVRTRSPTGGMISGSCSLGEFVPYTRPRGEE